MVMTDVSGVRERADALGKLGVSYGVGMVVGPTLGGLVTTHFSEQMAAGLAAAICLLAMIIVLLFVPANTKNPSKLAEAKVKDKSGKSVHESEWSCLSVMVSVCARCRCRVRGSVQHQGYSLFVTHP